MQRIGLTVNMSQPGLTETRRQMQGSDPDISNQTEETFARAMIGEIYANCDYCWHKDMLIANCEKKHADRNLRRPFSRLAALG